MSKVPGRRVGDCSKTVQQCVELLSNAMRWFRGCDEGLAVLGVEHSLEVLRLKHIDSSLESAVVYASHDMSVLVEKFKELHKENEDLKRELKQHKDEEKAIRSFILRTMNSDSA